MLVNIKIFKNSDLLSNHNFYYICVHIYQHNYFLFVLEAALNLFINSYSQELLKEMKPDLRRKLVQVMTSFVEKLFAQVPYDAWIVE